MKAGKERKKKKNLRAASVEPLAGKIITTTSGAVLKQYPAKVGYHGTQREENLSPEE